MNRYMKFLCMIAVFSLLFLTGCKGVPQSKSNPVTKDTVTIGTIGANVLEEIEAYQPLMDYLNEEKSLDNYFFRTVAFVSLSEMKKSLINGETDFYIDSPFPIVEIFDEAGLELYLKRLKGGVAEYHSVIYVHNESDIESVSDLKGKVIAFEDEASTSSYFLPKASLMKLGYSFSPVSGREIPAKAVIGYRFSEDDGNTAVQVFYKSVDGGATNNRAYSSLPPHYLNKFKVIYQTESVPRHLIACRKNLAPALKNGLKEILIRMHKDTKGREVLMQFENTARIEEIENASGIILQIKSYLDILHKGS